MGCCASTSPVRLAIPCSMPWLSSHWSAARAPFPRRRLRPPHIDSHSDGNPGARQRSVSCQRRRRRLVDTFGQVWRPDQAYTPGGWGYVGGQTYTTTAPIHGTANAILYQSERWWSGAGLISSPYPTALYSIALKFAEIYPYTFRGSRVFDVRVEGNTVRRSLDLFSVAGRYTAYDVSVSGVRSATNSSRSTFCRASAHQSYRHIHVLLIGP